MNIISLQALVTKTAPFDGASLYVGNILVGTVVIEVQKLEAADTPRAVFQLIDSTDSFATKEIGAVVDVSGKVHPSLSVRFTFTRKDWPNIRFGVASADLRLSLRQLDGNTPVCVYQAWIEDAGVKFF